eukprot:scaffold269_cov404-Prasinococcus_capsulatus_cf.AAC.10
MAIRRLDTPLKWCLISANSAGVEASPSGLWPTCVVLGLRPGIKGLSPHSLTGAMHGDVVHRSPETAHGCAGCAPVDGSSSALGTE